MINELWSIRWQWMSPRCRGAMQASRFLLIVLLLVLAASSLLLSRVRLVCLHHADPDFDHQQQ
jgi:hypothetical protein